MKGNVPTMNPVMLHTKNYDLLNCDKGEEQKAAKWSALLLPKGLQSRKIEVNNTLSCSI